MSDKNRRGRPGALLSVALILAVVVTTGCSTSNPPLPEPTFTPFTVAPIILNREEIVAATIEAYPAPLRDAGTGGTVVVWFFIDEEGTVRDARLNTSSGVEALDQAALSVADVYRFGPALNGDQPVPVWVSFPITFAVR